MSAESSAEHQDSYSDGEESNLKQKKFSIKEVKRILLKQRRKLV
jgi:hypothetical protein